MRQGLQRFNAAGWNDTPTDILNAIKRAQAGVSELQKLGTASGIDRKFTLDGRLVGDIGELVVARHFKIVEHEKPPGHAHDLYAMIGSKKLGVQVKLRREAKTGKIEFKYQPQVLIVLDFKKDWSQWRIVFHGSGTLIAHNGITIGENSRLKNGKTPTQLGLSLAELERQHQTRKYSKIALKLKALF